MILLFTEVNIYIVEWWKKMLEALNFSYYRHLYIPFERSGVFTDVQPHENVQNMKPVQILHILCHCKR